MIALPAAAFTASILFDVLSLVADNSEHARSYQHGAADLLRFGLSTSLASVAIELADHLRAPAAGAIPGTTRKIALDGAIVAVYLLDLAARQKHIGAEAGAPRVDPLPIGLSLLGLAILGASTKAG